MSATNRRNTIMERRLVMTNVILSPESGGTLNAKILKADKETNNQNNQGSKCSIFHLCMKTGCVYFSVVTNFNTWPV